MVIKGDTRSLDNGSHGVSRLWFSGLLLRNLN